MKRVFKQRYYNETTAPSVDRITKWTLIEARRIGTLDSGSETGNDESKNGKLRSSKTLFPQFDHGTNCM